MITVFDFENRYFEKMKHENATNKVGNHFLKNIFNLFCPDFSDFYFFNPQRFLLGDGDANKHRQRPLIYIIINYTKFGKSLILNFPA